MDIVRRETLARWRRWCGWAPSTSASPSSGPTATAWRERSSPPPRTQPAPTPPPSGWASSRGTGLPGTAPNRPPSGASASPATATRRASSSHRTPSPSTPSTGMIRALAGIDPQVGPDAGRVRPPSTNLTGATCGATRSAPNTWKSVAAISSPTSSGDRQPRDRRRWRAVNPVPPPLRPPAGGGRPQPEAFDYLRRRFADHPRLTAWSSTAPTVSSGRSGPLHHRPRLSPSTSSWTWNRTASGGPGRDRTGPAPRGTGGGPLRRKAQADRGREPGLLRHGPRQDGRVLSATP